MVIFQPFSIFQYISVYSFLPFLVVEKPWRSYRYWTSYDGRGQLNTITASCTHAALSGLPVSKESCINIFIPLVLFFSSHFCQSIYQCLVKSYTQTIGLRMVWSRHAVLHTSQFKQVSFDLLKTKKKTQQDMIIMMMHHCKNRIVKITNILVTAVAKI